MAIEQPPPDTRSLAWSSRRGVRASAGSGKTYDLTGHYLRWLILGADPAGMLATTFTRKAASEILGRVMRRLAEACESEEALSRLADELAIEGLTRDSARAHLLRLCRALHRVSISTIDSFFGRVLRGFRHELGLPADVRILDNGAPEMASIRREAIAAVLGGEAQDELLDLLIALHRGNATQKVASDLETRLNAAHKVFQMAPREAWNVTLLEETLPDEAVEAAIECAIEAFSCLAHPGQRKTAAKEAGFLRARDWESLVSSGLATRVAAGAGSYYTIIPEPAILAYGPILAHARAAVLAVHEAHTQALLRLLDLYDTAYRSLCLRERVVEFGDVPLALARLMPGERPEEVGRRIDSPIEYLLLDEFQDTDPQQYAVLKPFADSIHALPKDLGLIYCVGDLKQSIYGWRGATPQIFERFGVDLPEVVWSDNDASYRSAQPVLDSVNALFGTLAKNVVLAESHEAVARRWQEKFHAHTAKKIRLAGFVRLLQSSAAENEAEGDAEGSSGRGDLHATYCADRVRDLAQAAPWATVGVLMRSNNAVRQMIFLLRRLGVAASAEGGSPIADDPAVSLVLSALIFADHPADSAALFHVMNSDLARPLRLAGDDALPASEAALAIRRRLAGDGYAATISGWASDLAASCDRLGVHHLLQLVELADEFDRRPGPRPMSFVEYVRAQSVEEPAPARVRVMTIHKAKGLEFDAVVLPELSARLSRIPTLVYERDPATLQIVGVSSYPSKAVRPLSPRLAAMCDGHAEQEVREALCLLYVAMTRARQSLTLIVPALQPRQDGSAKSLGLSLAAIVRAGLVGPEALSDLSLGEALYFHGDPGWHGKLPAARQPRAEPPSPEPNPKQPAAPIDAAPRSPRHFDLTGWIPRLRRQITPSSLVDDPCGSPAELLGLDDPARRRGAALHAMLAQVEWIDYPAPAERALIRAARAAAPGLSEEELAACLAAFRDILQRPSVRKALSRPDLAAGERLELWREREFLQIVDGDLVSGRLDRVVLVYAGDEAVRASLTDFKTMDATPAEAPALADRYRPQVTIYRKALCRMTGLAEADVSARLVFTGLLEHTDVQGHQHLPGVVAQSQHRTPS